MKAVLPLPHSTFIPQNANHEAFCVDGANFLKPNEEGTNSDYLVAPYTLCLMKKSTERAKLDYMPKAKRARLDDPGPVGIMSNFYKGTVRIDWDGLVAAGVAREGVQDAARARENPIVAGRLDLQISGTTTLVVDPKEFTTARRGDLLYWEKAPISTGIDGIPSDYMPINIKVYSMPSRGMMMHGQDNDDDDGTELDPNQPFIVKYGDKRESFDPADDDNVVELFICNILSPTMGFEPTENPRYVDQHIRRSLTDHFMQTIHMLLYPSVAGDDWRKAYVDDPNSPLFMGLPYEAFEAWVAAVVKHTDVTRTNLVTDSLIVSMCDGFVPHSSTSSLTASKAAEYFVDYMANAFGIGRDKYDRYLNQTVMDSTENANFKAIYDQNGTSEFQKAWYSEYERNRLFKKKLSDASATAVGQFMQGHGIKGSLLGDAIRAINYVNPNIHLPSGFKDGLNNRFYAELKGLDSVPFIHSDEISKNSPYNFASAKANIQAIDTAINAETTNKSEITAKKEELAVRSIELESLTAVKNGLEAKLDDINSVLISIQSSFTICDDDYRDKRTTLVTKLATADIESKISALSSPSIIYKDEEALNRLSEDDFDTYLEGLVGDAVLSSADTDYESFKASCSKRDDATLQKVEKEKIKVSLDYDIAANDPEITNKKSEINTLSIAISNAEGKVATLRTDTEVKKKITITDTDYTSMMECLVKSLSTFDTRFTRHNAELDIDIILEAYSKYTSKLSSTFSGIANAYDKYKKYIQYHKDHINKTLATSGNHSGYFAPERTFARLLEAPPMGSTAAHVELMLDNFHI